MIVAIDGPSGAGQSTVAKAAAKRLGFSCLDTGAMYRAIAWKALADGVSFDDAEALLMKVNEIIAAIGGLEWKVVTRRHHQRHAARLRRSPVRWKDAAGAGQRRQLCSGGASA